MPEDNNNNSNSSTKIVVLFGRPGAGKSTVAARVAAEEETTSSVVKPLDLDVCVPDWMRENFANGLYPTLQQRQDFAATCCDYVVEQQQQQQQQSSNRPRSTLLVSFSFVNTDLRDTFRQRFPDAVWILLDTSEAEAQQRVQQREGHFYKGPQQQQQQQMIGNDSEEVPKSSSSDVDNSECEFAPVAFPHTVLDGHRPVEENAAIVVSLVQNNKC